MQWVWFHTYIGCDIINQVGVITQILWEWCQILWLYCHSYTMWDVIYIEYDVINIGDHHDGPNVPRSICGCTIGILLWWEILFFVRYSVLIHDFELFSQIVHPLVSPLHLKIKKNFLSCASKVYTDESNQMVPSHLLRNWIFSSQLSWLETTCLISLGTKKHQEKQDHGGEMNNSS